MLAKLILVVSILAIGSLTPILPEQSVPLAQHKARCCADMNVASSHNCPVNNGASNSTSGSTCCVAPAVCLCLYLSNANVFAADSQMSGTIFLNDDRASTRSQRPPVPPPRVAFS